MFVCFVNYFNIKLPVPQNLRTKAEEMDRIGNGIA